MSTVPDLLKHLGGVPVGAMFGWSADSKIWFVDGNRSVSGDGKTPETAVKTIGEANTLANAWDVIYIAPKNWTSGNLWMGTAYQESTTDISLAYAKQGLALIGIGHQSLLGPPYGTTLKEVSSSTSPIITVNAPMAAVENLSFEATTATQSLKFDGDVAGSAEAALGSVYNCHFHGGGLHTTGDQGGAIYGIAVWGMTIDGCSFMGSRIGIALKSSTGTAGKFVIRNCDFFSRLTSASDISCDIYIYTQGSTTLLIDNINCAHLIPSYTNGHARWISVQADVRQGIISRVRCAGVQGTAYTSGSAGTGITCPANIGVSECYNGKNLLMVEA